jgi:hypothetical protein
MMTKQFQNILKGIGSVMDIAPSTDYTRFVPKKTATERMQEHWQRTGWHIQQAIDHFAHEQEEKK